MNDAERELYVAITAIWSGLRRARGMSREELAARIGRSAKTVERYEIMAQMPVISTLMLIATALGTTLQRLLDSAAILSGHAERNTAVTGR
ncbi:helix-turn-helix domain-containing protein [Nocardia sp. NPDC056611]|uniref:helix-turn-helix domain-containing protein n=1 Tax=Nocardia sp. NPDC056611 TaxID=3345877 RepID=UPI0036712EA9